MPAGALSERRAYGAGGVNSGGLKDTSTPPPPVCASLVNVSAPVGYYLSCAAVWNDFTVKNCSAGSETVNYEVTETNVPPERSRSTRSVPFP